MRRYVSVFVIILSVVKALKVIYGSEKGGMTRVFRLVCLCALCNVLF